MNKLNQTEPSYATDFRTFDVTIDVTANETSAQGSVHVCYELIAVHQQQTKHDDHCDVCLRRRGHC